MPLQTEALSSVQEFSRTEKGAGSLSSEAKSIVSTTVKSIKENLESEEVVEQTRGIQCTQD